VGIYIRPHAGDYGVVAADNARLPERLFLLAPVYAPGQGF